MFKKTLLARALTIAFGAAALSFAVTNPVMAQSNASGNIFGRVEAAAGSSISIVNLENGLARKVTPNADGSYRITSLPPGRYKVELSRNGAVVTSQEIDVLVGQGAEASFASSVETVKVVKRRSKIDITNTNNGSTFTAKELAKLPVEVNVAGIIQLAPNTTRADSRYPAGASFGGGGASENSYYINGFPVTNPLTQLGASELPFGAIAQADILTGGYGAEFGRSIGGVVNITTKSGTNNWELGASYSIAPNLLRARKRDFYYGNTGVHPDTDGTMYMNFHDFSRTTAITGMYAGGPIIKDKLFMFFAAESNNRHQSTPRTGDNRDVASDSAWGVYNDRTERYLGKLDWNLTDNHRLELTLIGDDSKRHEKYYGYDYKKNVMIPTLRGEADFENIDTHNNAVGANVTALRYVGNLTDKLTLSSVYGESKVKHINSFVGSNVNGNVFAVTADGANQAPGLTYVTPQPTDAIVPPNSADKTKSFRLDLEYKFGQHTLRGGFDNNKLISQNAGQYTAGGGAWVYLKDDPNEELSLDPAQGTYILKNYGGLGTQGYYVRKDFFTTTTDAGSDQSAQYIEDRYQVTKDILLTMGLRSESFKNKNGDGITYLEQKNQLQPRFAGSWNVNGDESLKIFGSAGRYSVQIPTSVAVRGASRSTNTSQFFTYTGVDANGAPTGLTQITGVASSNNEFGQAKDPLVVVAKDLKPNYQDELTLGFERALTPEYNIGSKITYRKLKSTIDDFCDQRPFEKWAKANGIPTVTDPDTGAISVPTWRGFGCASFNPGKDNSFYVDFNDRVAPGKTHSLVTLTKADLGFDDAKRTYTAIDMFIEHPFRNNWYAKAYYTWSKSRGNTEGQTLSDVGQVNVSLTQTWDHHELMEYADGLLPNNRTHQLKVFGYYELTPEWTVGANLLVASGRPLNCIGYYPARDTLGNNDYGSAYHYCNGVPSPRGTAGTLPWDVNLDMNVAYRPAALKDMLFKMDIFNVGNRQTLQNQNELYNRGGTINARYGRPLSYTDPRSVRFSVEYRHKF
jgi:hypothetical protein